MDEEKWMLTDLPSDSRDSIIRELDKNYWNAILTHHQFTLKKRSKKISQSMTIRLRDYNSKRGFYSFLKSMDKAELFPEAEYDLKLQMDIDQNYYLNVVYNLSSKNQLNKLERSKKIKHKKKLKLKKKLKKKEKKKYTPSLYFC